MKDSTPSKQYIGNQSKNSGRKILSSFQSHFYTQADQYHPQNNKKGYISAGVSVNVGVSKKILEYLPPFVVQKNLYYPPFKSSLKLNQILTENTPYQAQKSFAVNNMLTLIDVFSAQKNVSIEGEFSDLNIVLNHAKAKLVPYEQSQCHIIFASQTISPQKYLKGDQSKDKPTLIVVKNSKQIIPTKNTNVSYGYENSYSQGFVVAACHSKDMVLLKKLEKEYMLCHVSTLISTIIEHRHQQGLSSDDEAYISTINGNKNYLKSYLQMIQKDSEGVKVSQNNVYFGMGVIATIANCMMTIFNKGDHVSSEFPFYNNFQLQLHRTGIVFDLVSIFEGTLFQRVKTSFQKGNKGFFIINPHNPTGLIASPEEIVKICEWAKNQPNYHLIFDEVYVNSVYDNKTIVKSAISYANMLTNIHVVRGFAKDFGLGGFKLGIMVSCNQKVKMNFRKWRKIIQPQHFLIKAMSHLLDISDNGQDIYKVCRQSIQKATDLTIQLLTKYNIDFLMPQGGCFLLLNLSKYLQKHPQLSQMDLWLKIFYDYRVHLVPGNLYKMKLPGYFRMCHILEESMIREALRRLHNLINELPAFKV